jgi:hypothetical protein
VFEADDGVVTSASLVAYPAVAAATEIAMIVVSSVFLREAVMSFLVVGEIDRPLDGDGRSCDWSCSSTLS